MGTKTERDSGKLDAAERRALPDSYFGLPDRREFPMPDAAHVRAAEAYFHYAPDESKPLLARNILRKAEKFGVEVSSPTDIRFAIEQKTTLTAQRGRTGTFDCTVRVDNVTVVFKFKATIV